MLRERSHQKATKVTVRQHAWVGQVIFYLDMEFTRFILIERKLIGRYKLEELFHSFEDNIFLLHNMHFRTFIKIGKYIYSILAVCLFSGLVQTLTTWSKYSASFAVD